MELRVLGGFELRRDGAPLEMPPSKRTRALLAYLALTARSHRRERLCTLFWEDTDDPRAALRWSLSKLRGLVDEPDRARLQADRASVTIAADALDVDLARARRVAARGLATLSTPALEQLAEGFRGELLEGLELYDHLDYQAWLVAERGSARQLRVAILRALAERASERPVDALPHARALVEIDPLDEAARAALIRWLGEAGLREEAEQHYEAALKVMAELGRGASGEVTEAWRAMRRQPAPAAPAAPARATAAPSPFGEPAALVGRAHEWSALARVLAEVRSGAGARVVLVLGEPGIGKSRLLAELARAALRDGGSVLAGRFYEAESGRPYGAWIDALRALPAQRLEPVAGAALAPLVAGTPEAPGAPSTREQLFGAVVELVGALTADAVPLLLVLDDVQWCDDASAALLHHVARMCRDRPLAIALGAREGELPDNEAIQRVLRGLRREAGFEEVVLAPLAPDEIAALVAAAGLSPHDPERLAESGGNPLFALELVRVGVGRAADGIATRVPATLAGLVRERLERLPSQATDVLRWGAVLGRSFGLGCLTDVTGLEANGLVEALETLERHALVRVVERPLDPRGGYAFTHDVVQRVVYDELSEPRRRLMHARVASALAAIEDGPRSYAADIAHHASLAGDHAAAARACVQAGRRCLAVFANAEAESLARRGMRSAQALAGPERTRLEIDLTQVALAARRPVRAEPVAKRLEELARAALDEGSVEHARLGFHLLAYLRWDAGEWSDAERHMREAEQIGRASEPEGRVVALAEAARCLAMLERDLPHAEALLMEASALAERAGVEAAALDDAAGMLRLHGGELEHAARLFDASRALSRRVGDRLGEFQALEHRFMLDLERGDVAAASGIADELVRIAAKLREGSEAPFARALVALTRHALVGPVEGAGQAELDAAIEELERADAKHRLAYLRTRASALELAHGHPERASRHAAGALEAARHMGRPSETALARVALARAARALGDDACVAREIAELTRLARERLATPVRRQIEALLEGVDLAGGQLREEDP